MTRRAGAQHRPIAGAQHRPIYVAVCGSSEEELASAEAVGRLLAAHGVVVVTGGLGGVMASAARGARSAGGVAIGILPGPSLEDANPHVTYAVATGLGEARNAIIATTVDAMIAVGGGWGTLSEIALALRRGIPVVGLGTWEVAREGEAATFLRARTAEEAVELALERAVGSRR